MRRGFRHSGQIADNGINHGQFKKHFVKRFYAPVYYAPVKCHFVYKYGYATKVCHKVYGH